MGHFKVTLVSKYKGLSPLLRRASSCTLAICAHSGTWSTPITSIVRWHVRTSIRCSATGWIGPRSTYTRTTRSSWTAATRYRSRVRMSFGSRSWRTRSATIWWPLWRRTTAGQTAATPTTGWRAATRRCPHVTSTWSRWAWTRCISSSFSCSLARCRSASSTATFTM